MSTLPTEADSVEVRQVARKQTTLYSAWFGQTLRDGDTLASVVSVTQVDQPDEVSGESNTLTLGSGAVNSGGAVSVDGKSRATNTVIQFRVTAGSTQTKGSYVVEVIGRTTGGDDWPLRCRFVVV